MHGDGVNTQYLDPYAFLLMEIILKIWNNIQELLHAVRGKTKHSIANWFLKIIWKSINLKENIWPKLCKI